MVNEFKNTQMKEALAKIKEKQTTETINTMLAALMTTKFLAPATWDKEPTMNDKGQMIFEPNTKFQLMIIETNQKDCYFPMFTDMEELRKWNSDPKIRSLVLTFEQFMPFILILLEQIYQSQMNSYLSFMSSRRLLYRKIKSKKVIRST